jgi:hypothetical protein
MGGRTRKHVAENSVSLFCVDGRYQFPKSEWPNEEKGKDKKERTERTNGREKKNQ